MANYIDGFTLPIPRVHLNEYRSLAEKVAEIWKEHGALEYREYVGDDLSYDGLRSFTNVVDANETDVVVFGWVAFESREARDLANDKVAADTRMEELVAASNSGFDAAKMVYGGFKALV